MRAAWLVAVFAVACVCDAHEYEYYCGTTQPEPPPALPENAVTRLVQVVVRHGDRTPNSKCWSDYSTTWNCSLTRLAYPSEDGANEVSPAIDRMYRQNFLYGRNQLPGNCEKAQLTDIGHAQHLALGAAMRDEYVTKRGFLPGTLSAADLYVRHDLESRTQQSAMAFIDGLYPPTAGLKETEVVDMYCQDAAKQDLAPNADLCKCVTRLEAKAVLTPEFLKHELLVSLPLNLKLEKMLGFPVVNQEACDCALAMYCHGLPWPENFTEELMDELIEDAEFQQRSFISYPNASYYGRYGMGFLMAEMYELMLDNRAGAAQPRFALYSAHDSSVRVLLNMLGVFDGTWPAYASYLAFELYTDTAAQTDRVRLTYNGRVLSLPACQKTTRSDSDCSFDVFAALVATLTPTDPDRECGSC
eukprot:TRINITY_DN2401_c0_g1_i1.p1 TRINITY_DN2401_c0_g1~~TRINITY_DN2401_c0_g1_i1.p1  ORF type:complete len:430 (-),score=96.41 TRINITY_DN2401_c0_g1_i1:158-1402(-)